MYTILYFTALNLNANAYEILYFFVAVVSSDDTETVAASAVELQKPCEKITLRPTNSSFDNGEGKNSAFLPLSFLKFTKSFLCGMIPSGLFRSRIWIK